MRISIVTAVRNAEQTIARTIESVGAQAGVEIEHIVIDGASTDNTLNILKDYEDRLSILISEPDNGIYDAINKGINLATGDIIGIINSDDYYASQNILSSVMSIFENNSVDAVYGDLEYFSIGDIEKVKRIYSSRNFNPQKIDMGLMPAHPTFFLKRQVYEKYGFFKSDYQIAGDFEFIARIFKSGFLKYYYLPLIMVRMQLGGVSTQGLRSTILLNKEIMRACRENGIKTNYLKLLSRYPKKFLEYITR